MKLINNENATEQYKYKLPTRKEIDYYDMSGVLGKYENNLDSIIKDGPFLLSLDGRGMIDGGDTTFHTGHALSAQAILHGKDSLKGKCPILDADTMMKKLYAGKGLYRRHPDKKMWYSENNRVGRDQQKPVIMAESFIKGSWKRVVPFILRHFILRLGLFEAKTKDNGNDYSKVPTLTFFTIWASYIRYFIAAGFWPAKVLIPLLWIFDIEIFINGKIKAKSQYADKDVLNHIAYSYWFATCSNTYFSRKNMENMDREDMIARLRDYYDDGRCPFFVAEMWVQILRKN